MGGVWTAFILLQGSVVVSSAESAYCRNPDNTDIYCQYGCCGNSSFSVPCCEEPASIPPFSIFFYALTTFILFLLIVCCIGKVARLKQRYTAATSQPQASQTSSRRYSQRASSVNLSRSLMITTIDLISAGRRSMSSNQDAHSTDIHPTTDLPVFPPSYDDAIKTPPPELPPPYTEVVNSQTNTLPQQQNSTR